MTEIEHPTGRVPQTVVMLSLGPSKHDALELTAGHEPTAELMEAEWWGINGGANFFGGRVAYDMLWVMDHLDGEARREPGYIEYLMRWKARFDGQIMTSVAGSYAGPGIHEYPLQAVLERVGGWDGGLYQHAYLHNSIPYVIAYAMAIGVKRLILFGADYVHEHLKGRERDRSCAEYWVALARQSGMQIAIPSSSTLCNTNEPPRFYGYPWLPRLNAPGGL